MVLLHMKNIMRHGAGRAGGERMVSSHSKLATRAGPSAQRIFLARHGERVDYVDFNWINTAEVCGTSRPCHATEAGPQCMTETC